LNDLSKEDNVAFHEYTHAVSHYVTGFGGAEGGAMNEATSDYYAGTINNDSKIGAWAMHKLGKPWMRNMDNKKHYPEDIHHEVHADGEIWGGTLWDIRNALGASTADKTIFKGMHYYGSKPDFAKAASSIIQADKDL